MKRGITMNYILRTFNIVKKYGKNYALDKENINICEGDIYGFVGENGSGKTTIIRVITGLIFPDEGTFELFGCQNTDLKISDVKKKIGAIVESPSIYMNMSAYDNLKMQCDIIGVKDYNKIYEVLKDVGLHGLYSNKKTASNFSLGMRQRLGIAMALLGDPKFLILDEPMNGLDPAGIVDIRELIIKLNREKKITFLISSHILTELALVATKYGIISKGKIIKEISAEQLNNECRKKTIIEVDDGNKAYEVLSDVIDEENIKMTEKEVVILGDVQLNIIFKVLIENNITIFNVKCDKDNIEDYYLNVTKGGN